MSQRKCSCILIFRGQQFNISVEFPWSISGSDTLTFNGPYGATFAGLAYDYDNFYVRNKLINMNFYY